MRSICLAALLLVWPNCATLAEVRTWHSNDGKSIEAELRKVLPNGKVKLFVPATDKLYSVDVSRLSKADHDYIRDYQEEQQGQERDKKEMLRRAKLLRKYKKVILVPEQLKRGQIGNLPSTKLRLPHADYRFSVSSVLDTKRVLVLVEAASSATEALPAMRGYEAVEYFRAFGHGLVPPPETDYSPLVHIVIEGVPTKNLTDGKRIQPSGLWQTVGTTKTKAGTVWKLTRPKM